MIKQNGIILLENDDLGVDIHEIYQSVIHYDKRLPDFDDIYDAYKIEVMNINMEAHTDKLKLYLSDLRQGKDFEKLKQLEIEELPTLEKVELHFYLNKRYYSFAAGRKDIFNPPILEVW